jgi:hypothetical protein
MMQSPTEKAMDSALFSKRNLHPAERRLLEFAMSELPDDHPDRIEITQINCDAILLLFGEFPFIQADWRRMAPVVDRIRQLERARNLDVKYETYITSLTRLENVRGQSHALMSLESVNAYLERHDRATAAYFNCRDTLGRIALAWQSSLGSTVYFTMEAYRRKYPVAA